METRKAAHHTIVEQLPVFLQLRRRKWTGLQPLLAQHQLARPPFFLLRVLAEETAEGQMLTVQQMQERLFNPYATQFPFFDYLPPLVEQGYLRQQSEGYLVTERGRALVDQVELAARAYMDTLQLSPAISGEALAATLVELVHRSWQSPEPRVKAHQARTQRRLPIEGASALAQIEWAILGLWEARDDAHIAAWQAYQFSGPIFDIFSRIWSKQADTVPDVIALLEDAQSPVAIQQGLFVLVEQGHIAVEGEIIALTPHGQKIRDSIESETDRMFFAPWAHLADVEVVWLSEQLSTVCSFFKELF